MLDRMMLGRSESVAIGVAVVVLVAVVWTSLVAMLGLEIPGVAIIDRPRALAAACVFVPRTATWTTAPYAEPLHLPQLSRAADGSVRVHEAPATWSRGAFSVLPLRPVDVPPAQRLEDGTRFVPAPDAAPEVPPRRAVPDDALERVAGGTWIEAASGPHTKASLHATTWLWRGGAWQRGPALPDGYELGATAALPDGRLVTVCWADSGNHAKLCTARPEAATFRIVPAPGLEPETVAVTAAGDHDVMAVAVRWRSGAGEPFVDIVVQLVDVDTGATRDGPKLPEPIASTPRRHDVAVTSLDDGRLVLAPTDARDDRESRLVGVPAGLLALGLYGAGVTALLIIGRRAKVGLVLLGMALTSLAGGAVCAMVLVLAGLFTGLGPTMFGR